jgi:integrase
VAGTLPTLAAIDALAVREWVAELVANGLSAKRARKAHQVEALAEAIAPPYGTLIRVAAYTGLRPCAYVALKVGRLDLLRGTVRVAEAAPSRCPRTCGCTTCGTPPPRR